MTDPQASEEANPSVVPFDLWTGLLVTAPSPCCPVLSEHTGRRRCLMALVLGIPSLSWRKKDVAVAGIELSAKLILRIGVALLGMRISVDLLMGLGAGTILCSSRRSWQHPVRPPGRPPAWRGWLSPFSPVARLPLRASAAMAIAAVLPATNFPSAMLIFTVLSGPVLQARWR